MARTSGFKKVVVLGFVIFGLMVAMILNTLSPEAAQAAEIANNSQIKGKVTAITADGFSLLMDGNRQYTFQVTADTQFSQADKPAKFSDLKVGMLIGLLVKYNPTDHKYMATRVYLPKAEPTPPTCYTSALMSATVVEKLADRFTVKWTNGETSKVPFLVNSQTKFIQDGKPASYADLKAGQNIQFVVRACKDGGYTATEVHLPKAEPTPATCYTSSAMYASVLEKLAGRFTVKWTNGQTGNVAFVVNSNTKFFHEGHSASYADLKAGQNIRFVVRACKGGEYTATEVYF